MPASAERDELCRLRRENRQWRLQHNILSKTADWFAGDQRDEVLRYITTNQACDPLKTLAGILKVSRFGVWRSGFHAWC